MRAVRSAMSRTCSSLLACAALVVAAEAPGRAQDESFVPVTDAMLQDPDPADWLMWRRTLDGWGYSPLMLRLGTPANWGQPNMGADAGGAAIWTGHFASPSCHRDVTGR